MSNSKVSSTPTKSSKRKTNIVELAVSLDELILARSIAENPINLRQELFRAPRERRAQQKREPEQTTTQTLTTASTLEIKHPLLTFINDLNSALSECSEQALRPMPAIGIINPVQQQLDLSGLLGALEAGEKRLVLLSHSKPSLDILSNTSRHLAHQAHALVRTLRRSFISQESDPAHPSNNKIAFVLESVDNLYHNLHVIRLSFEDCAANLFLQAHLQSNPENQS